MIVCTQRHFAFIAIPKTGTTSIESALQQIAPEPKSGFAGGLVGRVAERTPLIGRWAPGVAERRLQKGLAKHATFAELEARAGDAVRDLTTFAFVRNPWSRLYSQYSQVRKPYGLERPRRRRLHEASLVSFEAYLRAYAEAPRPMWKFLVDSKGRFAVDYVGRFEFLQQDFDEICARLDLPQTALPRSNESISRTDYRSAYSEELRRLAAPSLEKDCELFGYGFEGLTRPHDGLIRLAER